MIKVCSRCGLTKPIEEFKKRKDSKDGYRPECKECNKSVYSHSLYNRKYAETHREQISESRKRRYKLTYQYKDKPVIFDTDQDGNIIKKCCICNQWFPISNYYSCKNQKHSITSMCIYCSKEKSKNFINNNKLYYKEYNKKYNQEPRRKAIKYFNKYGIKPTEELLALRIAYRELGQWIIEIMSEFRGEIPKIDKEIKFMLTHEYQKLRVDTLIRDNRHCVLCGRGVEDGIKLHVDHIIPLSIDWSQRLNLDNLQTLCSECNQGKYNYYSDDWRQSGGRHSKNLLPKAETDKVYRYLDTSIIQEGGGDNAGR